MPSMLGRRSSVGRESFVSGGLGRIWRDKVVAERWSERACAAKREATVAINRLLAKSGECPNPTK